MNEDPDDLSLPSSSIIDGDEDIPHPGIDEVKVQLPITEQSFTQPTHEKWSPEVRNAVLSARTQLWTPEVNKLIRRWKTQVATRQKGHLNQSRKFTRRHFVFGLPATILSVIVTTGVLATFREGSEIDQWVRFTLGLIGIASAALTAMITFMNYQEAGEKHKTAADSYNSLYGTMDTLLLLPPEVRGDPIGTLQNLRSQYDDNVKTHPTLPRKYDTVLTYTVLPEDKKKASKKPTLKKYMASSKTRIDLQNLLRDEGSTLSEMTEDYLKESARVNQELEQANAHDTDSEDVCLPFDLDASPINNIAPMHSIYEMASHIDKSRDEQSRKSMSKALKFELQRMK